MSSTRHTRSMARARPDPVQETTEVELLDEDESDDEVVLSSPAKRRHRIIASRQRAKSILKDGDEESEDDIQPSPIKRRARVHHLVSGTGHESIEPPAVPLTPVKSSRQQEQEDIDEDLEDLRSSGKSQSSQYYTSIASNIHRYQNGSHSRQGCFVHEKRKAAPARTTQTPSRR